MQALSVMKYHTFITRWRGGFFFPRRPLQHAPDNIIGVGEKLLVFCSCFARVIVNVILGTLVERMWGNIISSFKPGGRAGAYPLRASCAWQRFDFIDL